VLSLGRVSEPQIEVGLIAPGGSPALQISDRGKLRVSLDFQRDIGATGLYLYGPEASGGANVTLLHVPRRGPELWLREGTRTIFRAPANGI